MFYSEMETKLSPEQIGVFTEIAGCEASVSDLSMSEINLPHFTPTTTGHAQTGRMHTCREGRPSWGITSHAAYLLSLRELLLAPRHE